MQLEMHILVQRKVLLLGKHSSLKSGLLPVHIYPVMCSEKSCPEPLLLVYTQTPVQSFKPPCSKVLDRKKQQEEKIEERHV